MNPDPDAMTQANDGNAPIPNSATPPAPAVPGWRIGVLLAQRRQRHHRVAAFLRHGAGGGRDQCAGRRAGPAAGAGGHDPRSESEEYRRLAGRLLLDDEVNVIFGGCTSHCRKAMLPVVERSNSLLWYASVYEGFEYSPNVIYTGAAPNQGSMQLAAYLIRHCGSRIFLVGADYIYPRETNRIMRDTVEQHGGEILDETYLRLGCDQADINEVVEDIRRIQPDVVFSTLIGSDAERFYRRYHEMGLSAARMPIASLTMTEAEVAQVGPTLCAGHITAATYFTRWTRRPTRISWRAGGSARRAPGQRLRRGVLQPGAPVRPRLAARGQPGHPQADAGGAPGGLRRAGRSAGGAAREQSLRPDAAHRRVPAGRRLRRGLAERRGGAAGPVHDVAGPGRLLAGMR